MSLLSEDLIWWITVIDMPALGGLFWLVWRTRRESEQSVRHLRDLERRLVGHLLRIEAKLDTTSLKTEALRARKEK